MRTMLGLLAVAALAACDVPLQPGNVPVLTGASVVGPVETRSLQEAANAIRPRSQRVTLAYAQQEAYPSGRYLTATGHTRDGRALILAADVAPLGGAYPEAETHLCEGNAPQVQCRFSMQGETVQGCEVARRTAPSDWCSHTVTVR